MIRQPQLTFFIFQVNMVLDTGKYDFSLAEIKEQIKNKNIISFLSEKCVDDIDLSIIQGEDKIKMENALLNVAENINERRKLGVEKNGLCLLIAYLVEMIQHDYDTD